MLSLTLDTSCALNFLGEDAESSDALIEVIKAAIDHRVSVRVTEAAHAEVEGSQDEASRRERLKRLETFGRLELPVERHAARDKLAAELHQALFPNAQPGSRTDEHNRRDCAQLATHRLVGRDAFVTLDDKLRRKVSAAEGIGVVALSPQEVLQRLAAERPTAQVASVPAVAVRDAVGDQDEAAIREVLAPLADDYPDFGGWLTRSLRDDEVRIRVGEADGRVGAVALSKRKDERVMKLSAFYVADWARDHGLGQHLLWSEIRAWAGSSVEKIYVTVSSRHGELIDFFRLFGFLVEGVSSRRYQDDTSELVLGRHLVRETIDDAGLERFAEVIAGRVFAPPSSATLEPQTWALTPSASMPSYRWCGDKADTSLVEETADIESRRWGLLELETIFHPVRFTVAGRRALIVPIQPQWADAMLGYARPEPAQLSLLPAEPREPGKLLLRTDNAYYCYPTALKVARPGTPIIFLVTGGTGLVGEARILETVVDRPEELFLRFGGLGIYGVSEIRGHVSEKTGPNQGRAQALRFGLYVPYREPVARPDMVAALGRNLQIQTITPVLMDDFETLRRKGGLTW